MLLKKQVRGGVLLYALFMAGIFTLLLHVYSGAGGLLALDRTKRK